MNTIYKEGFFATGLTVEASWKELWVEMPKAWQIFFELYNEIDNRMSNSLIDISLKKENNIYTQFICIEVKDSNSKHPKFTTIQIPRKQYLHYTHTGSLEDIASAFGEMHNWCHKMQLGFSDFKLDVGYTPDGNEKSHDLYIELI